MSRFESLVFAVIGVALLCGVGVALSYRSLIGAGVLALLSFVFVGAVFAYKARRRRQ